MEKVTHWAVGHIHGRFLMVDQWDYLLLALVAVISIPSRTVP